MEKTSAINENKRDCRICDGLGRVWTVCSCCKGSGNLPPVEDCVEIDVEKLLELLDNFNGNLTMRIANSKSILKWRKESHE